jgi:CRISPR-associated protein Cmr3
MSTSANGWVGLRLDPLDTLFFRDGRPFDAATRVAGGLPNPQTLAGALRTSLLARANFDFARFAKQRKATGPDANVKEIVEICGGPSWITGATFRGPWVGKHRGNSVEPLLPSPEILKPARHGTGWSRAHPLMEHLPGWADADRLKPLWPKREADPKAEPGFLTLEGLLAVMDGNDPPEEAHFTQEQVYDFDNRVGIGIDMHTLTSAEGELYGIRLLALRKGFCLYAEMKPGPEAPPGPWLDDVPVPFGGEGKYVSVREVRPRDWPAFNQQRRRSLWYLATPTFLSISPASRRPLPRSEVLRAAASGPGVAFSGWDVARNGPRPTRFAVPAGAVYFLEGPGAEEGFLEDAEGNKQDLLNEGWGFALQGAWKENLS